MYFVAYAPDGNEAAWTAHMADVQKVMDERFATKGRSIILRNHHQTLLSEPFFLAALWPVNNVPAPASEIVLIKFLRARSMVVCF